MDPPLFRNQSLVAHRQSGFGPVSIASPPSHTLFLAGSVLAASLIVLWLIFGHYTRRERAIGTLVPQAGLVKVAAREGGTITEVLVSEGDTVTRGQALLRISGEKSSQALGNTSSGVTTSIKEQEAELTDEMKGVEQLGAQKKQALRRSEDLLFRQLEQYRRQLSLSSQLTVSYVSLLERIRPLVKQGYVSQLQIQQQEAQTLDSKAQTEVLIRQKTDTERQLSDTRSQLDQLPIDSDNKLNELRRQRAQLQQAILENEAARLTTTVAASNGTVSSLLAVGGQTVTVGEPLLTLLPAASPLEAQLLVPSSAIGFVHIGTPVKLHFVAFPYQKFGIQGGHVTQVSRSALTVSEAATIAGEQPQDGQSRYRIRVAIDAQHINAYGKPQNLLPGMAVEADLMLDRRTLLEWLFEPLFGARQRLMEARP
jgi:membrane fusion protein